jgi:hypothetical protein
MTTRPLVAPATELEVTTAKDRRVEGRQRGGAWTLWAFALMFLGVAIGVIGKMAMHNETVTVVGVLVSLAGMFLTVYPYVLPTARVSRDPNPSSAAKDLASTQGPKSLPPERSTEYVPSITERTTELLEKPATTRPGRNDDGEAQVEQPL